MEVALAPVDEIPEGGTKKVDFFGRAVLLGRRAMVAARQEELQSAVQVTAS